MRYLSAFERQTVIVVVAADARTNAYELIWSEEAEICRTGRIALDLAHTPLTVGGLPIDQKHPSLWRFVLFVRDEEKPLLGVFKRKEAILVIDA